MRICPFCQCEEVTVETIEIKVFGPLNPAERVAYCLNCGANAPEDQWNPIQEPPDAHTTGDKR